jgi:hypothetical protein
MTNTTTNNSFLPEDYSAPSSASSFMKLENGESNFRILSPAVVGWEYWSDDKKVFRSKEFPTETPNIRINPKTQKEEKPKHFWAFVVWNYAEEAVQVLHISQKTIQKDILNLVNDADWGDPMEYDLKISRSGKELTTKYQISPKPKKPVAPEILEEFEKSDINLEDMYFGNKAVQEGYEAM